MKVRFTESQAGRDFVYGMGEVYDFPAPEAKYWIQNNVAVAVEEEELPEEPKVVVQRVRKTYKRPVK